MEIKTLKRKISALTEPDLTNSILKTLQEGIILFDLNNEVLLINPATRKLLNWEKDKTIPERKKEFIFSPLFREISENKDSIISKEVYLESEKRILEAIASPLNGHSGEKIASLIVLRDITKAKEVDRMKTEFIANTSHELRTPLTTMKEFTSILLDELAGPLKPDQKEYLNIIKGNIERLNRIIGDLLDISKLEAGKMVLHPELVSIPRLVNQIIYLLGSQIKSKGISLNLSFPSRLPRVYVDVDRITQVFINLVSNGIKFTPPGGKISIGARKKNEYLQIMVEDSGTGIAPDNQKIIFDRFRQIGRTPGPGARGTGLGLPICKEIVRLHNGDIWVESQLDKGSKFIFTLPAVRKYRTLIEYLDLQIEFARAVGTKFSFILFKVTNYDRIKSKFGQKETQTLLRSLRNLLEKELRKATDMIVTLQREEFYIGLPKTDKEGALILVKRIKHIFCSKKFGGSKISFFFKIGLVAYPTDAGSSEELIKKVIGKLK